MMHCGNSFKSMKSFIYNHCKNGFYVHAKPNLCDPKTVTKYIERYLGRPVIATSRIDSYDGIYNKHHENDKFLFRAISTKRSANSLQDG